MTAAEKILKAHPDARRLTREDLQGDPTERCWRRILPRSWHAPGAAERRCTFWVRWEIVNGTAPEHRPRFCARHAVAHLRETGRLS